MPKTPPTGRKSTDQPGGYAERLLERVRRPSTPKRPSITELNFVDPITEKYGLDPEASSSKDSDILTLSVTEDNQIPTPVKIVPLPKAQPAPKPTPPERFASFDAWMQAIENDCSTLQKNVEQIKAFENAKTVIYASVEQMKGVPKSPTTKALVRYQNHRKAQSPVDKLNDHPSPLDNLFSTLTKELQENPDLQKTQEQLTDLEKELAVTRQQLVEFGLHENASIEDINALKNNSLNFISALKGENEIITNHILIKQCEPLHPDITNRIYKAWLPHLKTSNNTLKSKEITGSHTSWGSRITRSTSQEELVETAKPVRRVTYAEGTQPPSTQEAPKKSAFYL